MCTAAILNLKEKKSIKDVLCIKKKFKPSHQYHVCTSCIYIYIKEV